MFNTIISAVFLFFALIVLLVGILGSRKRHWISSAIKLVMVVISATIAVILSTTISRAVATPIYSFLIEKVTNEQILGILSDIPSAEAIFCVFVALVLTIPIFILIFAILRTLTNVICNKPLTRLFLKLAKKDPKEKYQKKFNLLSMLFSALASFLIYIVILIPIVGSLDLAASVAKVSATDETVIEIATAATDNVGSKTVRALGGKRIYNFLTQYEVNGEKVVMAEESKFISATAQALLDLSEDTTSPEAKAESLRNAGDLLENTTIVPTLVSDFVNAAGEDWLSGKDFHGIDCPSIGEQFDPIIRSFLECTDNSTCPTMREDLKTLINVIAVFVEKNTESSNDQDLLFNILSNQELITGISLEILSNERLAPMMGTIMNMSLDMIGETLELPDTSDEVYDEFINDVIAGYRETVTDSADGETLSALTSEITLIFNDHGIELPDGVDACIATSLICQFGDGSQMTPEALKEFFSNGATTSTISTSDTVSASTVAQKITSAYTEGDDEDALKDKIVAILTELRPFESNDAEEIAAFLAKETLSALESKALYTTSAQFVDANDFVLKNNIVIRSNLKAVSASTSNTEEEAHDISAIFSSFATIIKDISNGNDNIELLIKDLGPLLDSMSASELIGKENADKILIAIMQSDTVRSNINIPLHKATEMALSINRSVTSSSGYKTQLSSLSNAISMLKLASDGKNSAESAAALLADITPEAAEALKSLLSSTTIKNYGVTDSSAESVSGLVTGIVDNMSSAKDNGISEDNYQKEAQAVNDMMNIAMSVINNPDADTFGANGSSGITATEYINRALDSEIISNTLIDYVYAGCDSPITNPLNADISLNEAEKQEIVSALNAKMQEKEASGNTADLEKYKKAIISVASIVNFEVYIDASGNIIAK